MTECVCGTFQTKKLACRAFKDRGLTSHFLHSTSYTLSCHTQAHGRNQNRWDPYFYTQLGCPTSKENRRLHLFARIEACVQFIPFWRHGSVWGRGRWTRAGISSPQFLSSSRSARPFSTPLFFCWFPGGPTALKPSHVSSRLLPGPWSQIIFQTDLREVSGLALPRETHRDWRMV